MKVTFILKDKSDIFYNGGGYFCEVGLLQMEPLAQWERLQKQAHDGLATLKIGTGQFRDKVELNQILRSGKSPTFKLEPRKGYKLATFDF